MRFFLALILSFLPAIALAQTLDYEIGNQTFPSFRADLNAHLDAIVQHNAGPTQPAVRFPYMVWADTSGATPIYRFRNAANSAWITAFEIEAGAAEWLGKVTTSSADINGGAIDGTPIGTTTPAAGTFTQITGTGIDVPSSFPQVVLDETDGASTHRKVSLFKNANVFSIRTLSSANASPATDYAMTMGASGAVSHSWRVVGTERLLVDGSGATVTGNIIATGGLATSAASSMRTINPSTTGQVLGTIFSPWNEVVANSVINLSDARLKDNVTDVAEAECRAADRIQIRRYTLNSDAEGKMRFGVLAQEVIAAFEAEGLDWRDYNIVAGYEDTSYGVAYDELQALKIACL
jgi:hypothetical protein